MKGNKWVPRKNLADVGDASQYCMVLQEFYSIRYQGEDLVHGRRQLLDQDKTRLRGK